MVAQPPTDDLIADKRQERLRNFNWRRDYYEVQGAYHMTIIKWTLSIQVFVIKMECFLVSIYLIENNRSADWYMIAYMKQFG